MGHAHEADADKTDANHFAALRRRLAGPGPAVYNLRRRDGRGARNEVRPAAFPSLLKIPAIWAAVKPWRVPCCPLPLARVVVSLRPRGEASPMPKIAFEKYTLPNGLDVILHVDHTAPIVGVNVWYHAGSKNERPGRTGFAHLFEHMMFQGSLHVKNYFGTLQAAGGKLQRLDRDGPDELLGDRAAELSRTGLVDGGGPHGLPPPGDDPAEARQPARRGEERAAAELREPPLRPGLRDDPGGDVSAGLSLQLADHRRDDRLEPGVAGGHRRLLPPLLSSVERQPVHRRRFRSRAGEAVGGEVFRRPCPPDRKSCGRIRRRRSCRKRSGLR